MGPSEFPEGENKVESQGLSSEAFLYLENEGMASDVGIKPRNCGILEDRKRSASTRNKSSGLNTTK